MRSAILVLAGVLALQGCSSTRGEKQLPLVLTLFEQERYEECLRAQEERIALRLPKRNFALERMRLGMAAFEAGNYGVASLAFKEAIASIGDFARVRGEREALSKFGYESSASFKGYPYERMMLLMYYGFCQYRLGRYEDALAAFKNAIAEDYASELKVEAEKTKDGKVILKKDPDFFACDSVLAHYMVAQCYLRLGERESARNALDDARKQAEKRSLPIPGQWFSPDTASQVNLLAVIGVGRGPVKVRFGRYGEICKVTAAPGGLSVGSAWIAAGGTRDVFPAALMEDILFQATTRGGRKMDHVLRGKAEFKAVTDAGGDVLVGTGAVIAALAENRDTMYLGLALMVVGGIFKAISWATTPEADVRCWEMLPERIYVVAANAPPGRYTLTLGFSEGTDPRSRRGEMEHLRQVWHHIVVPARGQTFLCFRAGPTRRAWAARSNDVAACFDTIGHKKGSVPFAIGGTCCCTPTPELMRLLHADGIAREHTVESLRRLYEDHGIQLRDDGPHACCNNACDSGPHVMLGGRCMSPPLPGTRNFERVFSASRPAAVRPAGSTELRQVVPLAGTGASPGH